MGVVQRSILGLPGIAALFAALAVAQTGEVRIEVKDASGGSVQTSGKLDNVSSRVSRGFRTDSAGKSSISGLPYGTYRLAIAKPGFNTYTSLVNVNSATPFLKPVSLVVGAANYTVNVVGVTPLGGVDLPIDQIPAPVQTLTSKDLESTDALDLSELMNRRLDSVHINETQNNPFQPDVNYRGYTASPLLGTPEGMSVYMDGVRLNQPFGDVVSWDLIPKVAVSEVDLIPGSNPVYGLNTLGGALSLQTKSGASQPGTSLQASGGSFGRRAVEFDHGWSNAKGFNWYVAGNLFHDDGWRVASPSDIRQAFSRIGWQGAKTSISLSGSYADNDLVGNGFQESRLLALDYGSAYTIPDHTINRAPFLNLTLRHTLSKSLTLSGNIYFRYIRADTLNGDLNDDSLDQSVYQLTADDIAALIDAGYTGFPASGATASNTPFPSWPCIAQVLQNGEPGEICDGIINRTYLKEHNWGFSAQATWNTAFNGMHNQMTVGAGQDRSSIGFTQTAQLGYINPDKTITALDAIADGRHAGTVDDEPFDARVLLRGLIHTSSFFVADSLQVNHALALTLAGRFNRTIVDNRDGLVPIAGSGSLTGHYDFTRFNPSVGVTFSPYKAMTLYASYSEGSRSPTSIELGCADPSQPCKLPNSFAGDPPLKQVVTRTVEAGVRGGLESRINWNVGWFFGQNSNDILFVSSTATGFGYFKNFGKTRRQGVEAGVRARVNRFTLGGNYTFLDATYQSPEVVAGAGNSTNDSALDGEKGLDGDIQILPGDRIPLIPQHLFKAYGDYQATSKLLIDVDFRAVSTSYARGNENNLSQPDGIYYLGPGISPGYGVTDLSARYQLLRQLQAFVQINNLFDHKYYTAALIAPTGFTATGNFIARPLPAIDGEYPIPSATFYAPGTPRSVMGGLKFTF